MNRPIILGLSPHICDFYRKDARQLFADTGGNTGNLAFIYAVTKHVPDAKFMHWGASPAEMRAAGDVIVLPLANQLGKHTDLGAHAERLEAFGLPVIGLGLGAQAASAHADIELTEGTMRWLQALVRLSPTGAPNLAVRGHYTKTQITRLGMPDVAVVTGCPSNFINLHGDIADSIAKGFARRPTRIAVAAGIPYIKQLAEIERNLIEMVSETGGAYIVQHGLEMLQLARNEFANIAPETLSLCHKYMRPHDTIEEFMSWCRKYSYAFYDLPSWMDFLRRFDVVIGTRIHGAMLAIQAGVPAACIAHDSRTMEMCETMGVPVRHYTEINEKITKNNVFDYFSFDPEAYRATRRQLQSAYVGVLKAADLRMPRALEVSAA